MSGSSKSDRRGEWLFVGVPRVRATGGSLRAGHLPATLIERTDGAVLSTFGRRGLPSLAVAIARRSGLWRKPVHVATSRLWLGVALRFLRGPVVGRLLDLHDHPSIQSDAFGIPLTREQRARLDRQVDANIAAFELLAVQSTSFAELCRLPADRILIAPNGTDTAAIRPGPDPVDGVVAMISGGAPGRGIELLIDAVERLRADEPGVTLRLGLAATGPASRDYIEGLRARVAARPWISARSVPYSQLTAFLAQARTLVIPHPPHPYYDAVLPVKLFDGMAAGRPTVVTPRHETARLLRERDAGVVAEGDTPDELAQAIGDLLRDQERQARLGANARRAAVEEFDWRLISERLASAVLDRIG
jgi:glycosyltransferase involved in cell wall biosynthesis